MRRRWLVDGWGVTDRDSTYEGREVVHGFAPKGIILICFLLTQ
jgi:hypothetical protein